MRVGSDAAPAAGRGRFSRTRAAPGAPPGGHYEPSARSLALGGRPPPCASPKTRSQGGSNGRFSQSAARRSKEDAAMARHEAPASLERERGTERTMVAPPDAPSPSRLRGTKETTAYPAPEKMRAKMLAHAV